MAYLIKEPISSSSRGLRRQPRELNACLTQLGRGRAELDRRQCSLDYGVAGLLLRAKRASRLTFSSPPCSRQEMIYVPTSLPTSSSFLKTLAKVQEEVVTCRDQPGKQGAPALL